MSIALDVALFIRKSKTKLGLSLSNECILFKLAFLIGSDTDAGFSLEELAKECGISNQNLTIPLKKIIETKILFIEKSARNEQEYLYKFSPLIKNYSQMTDKEKERVHQAFNDIYLPNSKHAIKK